MCGEEQAIGYYKQDGTAYGKPRYKKVDRRTGHVILEATKKHPSQLYSTIFYNGSSQDWRFVRAPRTLRVLPRHTCSPGCVSALFLG